MLEKIKKNKKGFTLIELLVVIAILAVLATLYVPRIIKKSAEATETVEISNARTLAGEITIYNFNEAVKIKQAVGKEYLTGEETTLINSKLLSGRKFPNTEVVRIKVDDDGNAVVYTKSEAGTWSTDVDNLE